MPLKKRALKRNRARTWLGLKSLKRPSESKKKNKVFSWGGRGWEKVFGFIGFYHQSFFRVFLGIGDWKGVGVFQNRRLANLAKRTGYRGTL